MAKDKKGFILYADQLPVFEDLEDAEAGRLIKHILRYVSDMNPDAPDRITAIAFAPIKQQLKRDLVKYLKTCEKNRENVKKRWAGKDTKNTSGIIGKENDTKNTDNDKDTDTDNNATVGSKGSTPKVIGKNEDLPF